MTNDDVGNRGTRMAFDGTFKYDRLKSFFKLEFRMWSLKVARFTASIGLPRLASLGGYRSLNVLVIPKSPAITTTKPAIIIRGWDLTSAVPVSGVLGAVFVVVVDELKVQPTVTRW